MELDLYTKITMTISLAAAAAYSLWRAFHVRDIWARAEKHAAFRASGMIPPTGTPFGDMYAQFYRDCLAEALWACLIAWPCTALGIMGFFVGLFMLFFRVGFEIIRENYPWIYTGTDPDLTGITICLEAALDAEACAAAAVMVWLIGLLR